MSDLIDVQVELYPTLLRRLAAGEHLASQQDDTEKLAATLLAAEAIEAEKAAQAPVEKKAIDIGLSTLLMAPFALPAIKKALNKHLGNPELPTEGAELIQAFKKIMQGQAENEAMKRKMLMLGLGAAGAGALAVKALEGKKQDKAAADEKSEKEEKKEEAEEKSEKKLPPWLQGKSEKKDDEKSKSEKSDDEKSEKKDDKKSDEKKDEKSEKDEDEKDSADVAVSNNPAGKVAVKTGSPSAHAVLARLMKSFA
jgi:hypothetical protein